MGLWLGMLTAPAAAETAGFGLGAERSGHVSAVGVSADGKTYVRVGATFTGVLEGGRLRVALACDAQGVGVVASTGIEQCEIQVDGRTYGTGSITLPGVAAAHAGTYNTAVAPITVCVTGRAVPVLGEDARSSRCFSKAVGVGLEPPAVEISETVTGTGYNWGSGLVSPFACVAVASPTAVSTSVLECSVQGRWHAAPASMPGPFAAASGLATPAGTEVDRICWRVAATFASGSHVQATGCNAPLAR